MIATMQVAATAVCVRLTQAVVLALVALCAMVALNAASPAEAYRAMGAVVHSLSAEMLLAVGHAVGIV